MLITIPDLNDEGDKMRIVYDMATKKDIPELIDLRIAYMTDDFGKITEHEKEGMRKQLPDYFERKLGNELIAFVARSNEKNISAAYLQIIEMPANVMLLNGLYGEVLSVYTEPEYRGKGICTQLIKNLLEYGKKAGLGRVDLSATKEGYPVYKKVGFTDKKSRYTSMTYKYE